MIEALEIPFVDNKECFSELLGELLGAGEDLDAGEESGVLRSSEYRLCWD